MYIYIYIIRASSNNTTQRHVVSLRPTKPETYPFLMILWAVFGISTAPGLNLQSFPCPLQYVMPICRGRVPANGFGFLLVSPYSKRVQILKNRKSSHPSLGGIRMQMVWRPSGFYPQKGRATIFLQILSRENRYIPNTLKLRSFSRYRHPKP